MSRSLFWIAIFVVVILTNSVVLENASADEKILIGWLEKIYLPEYDLVLRAKIDTGAPKGDFASK